MLLYVVQRLADDLQNLERNLGLGGFEKLGARTWAEMPLSFWNCSTMRLSEA